MPKTGLQVMDASFQKATKALVEGARKNTLNYGKTIAAQFKEEARREAGWMDHRGVARRGFDGDAELRGNVVRVGMGARAKNYKRGPKSSEDYMEYLEFDYYGKYAIVYPMVNSMRKGIVQNFGTAALKGGYKMRIQRDKEAMRARKTWHRANANGSRMRGKKP